MLVSELIFRLRQVPANAPAAACIPTFQGPDLVDELTDVVYDLGDKAVYLVTKTAVDHPDSVVGPPSPDSVVDSAFAVLATAPRSSPSDD